MLLFDSCGCTIGAVPRNRSSDEKNSRWTTGGDVSLDDEGETGMEMLTVRWASGPASVEVVSASGHLRVPNLSNGDLAYHAVR